MNQGIRLVAILYALIAVMLIVLVVGAVNALDAQRAQAMEAYETCVQIEYSTTPSAWYQQFGSYPECDSNTHHD